MYTHYIVWIPTYTLGRSLKYDTVPAISSSTFAKLRLEETRMMISPPISPLFATFRREKWRSAKMHGEKWRKVAKSGEAREWREWREW